MKKESCGKKHESSTGGMSGKSGGPIMAQKDPGLSECENLDKVRESEDMQFESFLKQFIKEEIAAVLTEAEDYEPREDWAKFGKKVDDFINDTIEKCDELFKEGEDMLYDDDDKKESGDDKYRYISSRLGFLKNAKAKLAQRYEGLRREN